MFYTIYKTTNKIDGKIYIGKHQTKDLNDGYMGSGKYLKSAIEKYGLENFEKDILFIYDNEEEMNAKEAELVSEEFVNEDTNYNLCPGGKGGWGYNNTKEGQKLREFSYERWSNAGTQQYKLRYETDEQFRNLQKTHLEEISKIGIETYRRKYPKSAFYGKTHSEETKQKMRKPKNQGSKNPQFGTMWITNGKENKKIKKEVDIIPEGWYKGRVINN
jgi:hypothetical protein